MIVASSQSSSDWPIMVSSWKGRIADSTLNKFPLVVIIVPILLFSASARNAFHFSSPPSVALMIIGTVPKRIGMTADHFHM
jgi:hypothetical protein